MRDNIKLFHKWTSQLNGSYGMWWFWKHFIDVHIDVQTWALYVTVQTQETFRCIFIKFCKTLFSHCSPTCNHAAWRFTACLCLFDPCCSWLTCLTLAALYLYQMLEGYFCMDPEGMLTCAVSRQNHFHHVQLIPHKNPKYRIKCSI